MRKSMLFFLCAGGLALAAPRLSAFPCDREEGCMKKRMVYEEHLREEAARRQREQEAERRLAELEERHRQYCEAQERERREKRQEEWRQKEAAWWNKK